MGNHWKLMVTYVLLLLCLRISVHVKSIIFPVARTIFQSCIDLIELVSQIHKREFADSVITKVIHNCSWAFIHEHINNFVTIVIKAWECDGLGHKTCIYMYACLHLSDTYMSWSIIRQINIQITLSTRKLRNKSV